MNRNSIFDPVIENLIPKMRQVMEDVAEVWGAFSIFGLLESGERPRRWDVLVSAPNLPRGREGIFVIAEKIVKYLTPSEAILISRIVPISEESDLVRAMLTMAPDVSDGYAPIDSFTIDGRQIERGYILASQKNPPLMRAMGAVT